MLHKLILASLLFATLSADAPIPGALPSRAKDRLQFSSETEDYFKEELPIPSDITHGETRFGIPEQTVRVSAEADMQGEWTLTFFFPEKVSFTQKIEPRSIYIQFNQSVDSQDVSAVQELMGSSLTRWSNGYSTLELVFRENVHFQAGVEGNTFTLFISPDFSIPGEPYAPLKAAETRLFLEERHYGSSACSLKELQRENPNSQDAQILQSTYEGLLPNWQKSWRTLQKLNQENPDNQDIRSLMYETYSPHSSYVSLQGQLQKTVGQAHIYDNQVQGEGIVHKTSSSLLYLGASFQPWYGNIVSITNKQGISVPFKGEQNQGSIYVREEWDSGLFATATLYGQVGAVGTGIKTGFLWPLIQGDITFEANWHRPCWEVFEAYAYHGREDAARMELYSTCNRYVTFAGGAGMRRIGISGTPNGYVSGLANMDLFVYLTNVNPLIALNYGLDAEYVIYEKQKIGVDGTPFNPVPYQSFENHSFRAYLYYNIRNQYFFTLFGGETINRIGWMKAPTFGINFKYVKPCPWGFDVELSAYQFPSTIVNGATAQYFTATLTARF